MRTVIEQLGKLLPRMPSLLRPALVGVITACFAFAAPVSAKDKTNDDALTPPDRIFDNIPVNWDYYAISPKLRETYSGVAVKELVFDDDLIKDTGDYETLRLAGNTSYKVFKGAKDFIVVGQKHIVIRTPETGTNIIEAKRCHKSLRRAKYFLLNTDDFRRKYKRSRYFEILTRNRGGLDVCQIKSIREWTGPMDLTQLKQENDAAVMDAKMKPENTSN